MEENMDMENENYGIVGLSEGVRKVIEKIKRIGRIAVPVLITGESGTGKELVAHGIHLEGIKKGRNKEIICMNCSAMNENLVESELFGHIKGSFTGAAGNRDGAFLSAKGGTLFLDEVGELPLQVQSKLLRAVENKEVYPVGSDKPSKINVRIIAAASQDLRKMIAEGKFQNALYHRLNILNICIPSLRERPEDIPLLAGHFFKVHCEEYDFSLSQVYEICVKLFAEDNKLDGKMNGCELLAKAEELLGYDFSKNLYQTQGAEKIIEFLFKLYYGTKNMEAEFFEKMFVRRFSEKALKYDWPGNVRELSAAVLRSLVNKEIDIPVSFSEAGENQKTTRAGRRKRKKDNQKKAEQNKREIRKIMEEVVIGEYNGRISLAVEDDRLRKAGIDTIPKLIRRLDLVSLREVARDARKEFFGSISEKEIRERMVEYDGNIRKLCKHYNISFREINEHFGEMLKEIKDEIKGERKKKKEKKQ